LRRILDGVQGITLFAVPGDGNARGKVAVQHCPRTSLVDGCHPMPLFAMRLFAVILFGLLTAACNQEQDVTGSTPLCAMRNYSSYNPRDIKQCVAACKACDHGNTVTCTTSCTLHAH